MLPLPLAGKGEKRKGTGDLLGEEKVIEQREEICIEIGIGRRIGQKGMWVGRREEEKEKKKKLGDQRRE